MPRFRPLERFSLIELRERFAVRPAAHDAAHRARCLTIAVGNCADNQKLRATGMNAPRHASQCRSNIPGRTFERGVPELSEHHLDFTVENWDCVAAPVS